MWHANFQVKFKIIVFQLNNKWMIGRNRTQLVTGRFKRSTTEDNSNIFKDQYAPQIFGFDSYKSKHQTHLSKNVTKLATSLLIQRSQKRKKKKKRGYFTVEATARGKPNCQYKHTFMTRVNQISMVIFERKIH